MKKIFSFAIVLVAVAMVSCGGNAAKSADALEVETVEATEVVEGACCAETCDSTACQKACDSTACQKACQKTAEGECCKK